MPASPTRFVLDGRTAIVTMDHPAKRNALGADMARAIVADLDRARQAQARCLILRAPSGSAVWSAGHDIDEFPAARRDPLGWDDPFRVLLRAIEDFPAPVIALIEGGVWGGACEMAMSCDILVATPDVRFSITPGRLGVPYSIAGLLTLTNAAGLGLVKEMLFTAHPLDAERAERLGVVNHVVSAGQIEDFCLRLAQDIEALAPLALSAMKESLRVLAGAHAMPPDAFERLQGLRRAVYDSDDYEEGLRAFRERRKPDFKGR